MTAPDADGRDLRSGVRHGRLPRGRGGVPARARTRDCCTTEAAAQHFHHRHVPRLRLRQHHAAHRQHEHAAARRRATRHPLPRLAGAGARRRGGAYTLDPGQPAVRRVSLDYETTAKDLLQIVKTKKTELLFLALFLRLLKPGGRAAVIVPDGVLFGSTSRRTKVLVRLGRAEQHAVGHDDRGAAAGLEQPQEQGEEQQLGLLRLDDLQQVLGACSRSRATRRTAGWRGPACTAPPRRRGPAASESR